MDTIGSRIAQIIERDGLKKVQFAAKLGIHQSYVTKLVNGQTIPSDALVKLISSEFHVREEWLRTGEGPMEAPEPEAPPRNNAAIIAEVAAEFNLTETDKMLLTLYLEMGPDERDLVNAQILRMLRIALEARPPEVAPMTDAEIAVKVAEYEKLLKGAQNLERLQTPDTGMPKPTSASFGGSGQAV